MSPKNWNAKGEFPALVTIEYPLISEHLVVCDTEPWWFWKPFIEGIPLHITIIVAWGVQNSVRSTQTKSTKGSFIEEGL